MDPQVAETHRALGKVLPERRKAPQVTAWRVRNQNRPAPEAAAWAPFPRRSRTHPPPPTLANSLPSPCLIPYHAASVPLPASPQSPDPRDTPEPPPALRAQARGSGQGAIWICPRPDKEEPESAARMCRRHSMGPLHGAAEIDRRACRREPQGAAWPDSPKNYEPIPCRGLRPLPCYAAGVPLLASRQRPGCQNHSGYPAAPHHRHLLRIEGQGGAARRSMDVR